MNFQKTERGLTEAPRRAGLRRYEEVELNADPERKHGAIQPAGGLAKTLYRDVKRKIMQFGLRGFLVRLPSTLYGKLKYQRSLRARAAEDKQFDDSHAVETRKCVRTAALDIPDELLPHVIGYEPSPVGAVNAMLGSLAISYSDFVFIDVGAGKGRVMIMAAEYGFKERIGVEISAQLCERAKQNLGSFARSSNRQLSWSVVNLDASQYAFPNQDLVVYLYNPFDTTILERVMTNLEEAVRRFDRKIFVLYYWARFRAVINRSVFFEIKNEQPHWVIYQSKFHNQL